MRTHRTHGIPHRHHRSGAAAALLAAAAVTATAQAQWTVIGLHPDGAVESEVRSVFEGKQVGFAGVGKATVWQGTAFSAKNLVPGGTAEARAVSISGSTIGGDVSFTPGRPRAAYWTGGANDWVNLHPYHVSNVVNTQVTAVLGDVQVGTWVPESDEFFTLSRACMWNGTAESWIDLNPPGYNTSEVRGISGNQQVGGTFDSFLGQAAMWTGSAESFVSLNPTGAFASIAECTDGTYQYGAALLVEPVPALLPVRWNGTADSWVNMGVPDGLWGGVSATHGGYQVGSATDTNSENGRALLWTEPGSYINLHDFLPPGYNASAAQGIWRHMPSGTTYVGGYAVNEVTGRNEAVMWVSGPGANLIVSPGPAADCAAAPGEPMTYAFRLINAGQVASGPITLTVALPPASIATFASATPAPTSVTATHATFDLAALPGAAAGFADVSITLTAVGAGETVELTAVATTTGEGDPTNNTATVSSRILPTPVTTARAKAIFSTVPTAPTSLIPGGGGRYTGFNRPFASPSGNWFVMRGATDLPDDQNFVMVRAQGSGAGASFVLQEGVTTTPGGAMTTFDIAAEVNDSGVVAFAGWDGSGRLTGTTDGSSVNVVARAGDPIPSIPDVNYAANVGASVDIFESGVIAFQTQASDGTTAVLTDNGATALVQSGDTWPIGSPAPIESLVTDVEGLSGAAFDATGANVIYSADYHPEAEFGHLIVVNDTVLLEQLVTILPGMTSPVRGYSLFRMGAGGHWMISGRNDLDTEVWYMVGAGTTISTLIKMGDPIHAGASEVWGYNELPTITFGGIDIDASGNFVVAGTTTNPDPFINSVIVYNNQTVVARENDPVDLDGDGQFNDGVYIQAFHYHTLALLPDAVLVVVTLRDEVGALCHANDESRGVALLRIPLPCPADFNNSGSVTVQDIFDFLAAYFSSDPRADVNGVGGVTVQDIFDYLASYFQGC